ncbi:alpha/beta fold hydrolase [Sphingomonas sp. AR_OL41]|uniref:alpha/beta fold hydrolase n=1 Tax=Sphingomonas sp. AR_OL41 TaxID=3042729 RepID=UPI00248117C0|nr:alpha/beta fold hydrolase [Sphingomonas sp. AR_OL41]MDH7973266.1 alpha/beta fold hydrolase [Sphingomonas sp. AR_OL41]
MIRKSYADGRFGQVHFRQNGEAGGALPLICLHATAYSSRSYIPLLEALEGKRHAIAPDTPGYGESDPPPAQVAIEDYAEALAEILPARFDLFGYHSGVSMAVEIAIRHPQRVRRLALMGVPYFQALDFAAWRDRLTERHALGETLTQFAERWDYLVVGRPAGLSLRRGFENFVDELKAWPQGWWAHEALFAHDLAARLPLVTQQVTVINPPGHLAEPSRCAAALIPDARIIDLPELDGAALERHAEPIATLLLDPAPFSASAAGLSRRRNIPETAL